MMNATVNGYLLENGNKEIVFAVFPSGQVMSSGWREKNDCFWGDEQFIPANGVDVNAEYIGQYGLRDTA